MILRIVTIDEIKRNARIDGDAENDLLYALGEAAEQTVLNLIERTQEDLENEFGEVPAPVRQAILMYTNHLYEHRGIVNPTALYNVPYSIDAMLKPYIRYSYDRIHGGSSQS